MTDLRFVRSSFLEELEPSRSVLMVVDMQNDFVLPGAPMEVPMARKWIPNIKRLVEVCRRNTIPVIFTQHTLYKDDLNVSPLERFKHTLVERLDYYGQQTEARPLSYCILGTPGHEIIEDIKPLPSEIVVQKNRYDAFYGTNLDVILKNIRGRHGVDTVIIVGTLTNVCCESTARSAFMRDYKVLFVSDGNGGIDDCSQQATLHSIEQAFGEVVTTEEVLSKLSG